MNPKIGGSSTPPVGYLSLSNTYVHKNTHSWVEKECYCPHIVNITNVKFSSPLICHLFYFARTAQNIIDNYEIDSKGTFIAHTEKETVHMIMKYKDGYWQMIWSTCIYLYFIVFDRCKYVYRENGSYMNMYTKQG